MQFSVSTAVLSLAALAAAAPGDQRWGPSQFCQGLSPGGGSSCIDIPEGCFIIEPSFNIVPPVQCPRAAAADPAQASPSPAAPPPPPPAQGGTGGAPGETLFGPRQFCQTLSRGGGPPSCIDIPEGCRIVVPGFNTVPPVLCD